MQTVQFYGVEPQQLINEIAERVKDTLFTDAKKMLKATEHNQYLSTEEVCKKFSITKSTIYEWRKKKILKPYKLGSRIYFRMDEIEKAMITDF